MLRQRNRKSLLSLVEDLRGSSRRKRKTKKQDKRRSRRKSWRPEDSSSDFASRSESPQSERKKRKVKRRKNDSRKRRRRGSSSDSLGESDSDLHSLHRKAPQKSPHSATKKIPSVPESVRRMEGRQRRLQSTRGLKRSSSESIRRMFG